MATKLTAGRILKHVGISYAVRGLTVLTTILAERGLTAEKVLTPTNITLLATALVTGLCDLAITLYRKAAASRLLQAAVNAPAGERLSTIKTEAASMSLIPKG